MDQLGLDPEDAEDQREDRDLGGERADEAPARALARLGHDQAGGVQDPPDRRARRDVQPLALEMPGDGERTGVKTPGGELGALGAAARVPSVEEVAVEVGPRVVAALSTASVTAAREPRGRRRGNA